MHITRAKAALIHLTISLSIAVLVSALMLLFWYMPPLFSALGGQQVLIILLGVDVTLGPLITLIIYNPNKTKNALTLDLSLIAIIQLSALIYGMSIVFEGRPVFAVFSKNSFDLVTANSIRNEDLLQTVNPLFKTLSITGPIYVYTQMPNLPSEKDKLILNLLKGKDLPEFPQYFAPFNDYKMTAVQMAKSIAELKQLNPGKIAEIDAEIRSSGHQEVDLGYIPLRAKVQDLSVLIEKDNGEIIKLLKLRPW